LETPKNIYIGDTNIFIGDPQIFILDPILIMETTIFSLETPGDPQIIIGNPYFQWRSGGSSVNLGVSNENRGLKQKVWGVQRKS